MSFQQIIDPTISSLSSAPAPSPASVAGGPLSVASLEGLRIGVLENTKRNASQILNALADGLGEKYELGGIVRRTKRQFAMPFSEEQLQELRDSVDVVIIGVGDCGSCSAAAVADGIALESNGIPTAVIVTDVFEGNSRAMAKLKGDEDFDFIVTNHPVANLDAEGVRERGRSLVEDVVGRIVAGPPAVAAR
ncbi:MAG: UGSC family (seleno)protein [Pseudoclavibacter sp.]